MGLRFITALWLAKLSIPVLKITGHNATDFPGSLAIKICPDFFARIEKPETIIAVTGTNGKTTCANMICDAMEAAGIKVLCNRYGSNIATGLSTCLLQASTLTGKTKYDTAVLEIDERSAPRIFPYLKPKYMCVTNLFRDSIMRNGHPDYIAGILDKNIPKETKLILNGDDLISGRIAIDNPRVYYGIDKLDTDVDIVIQVDYKTFYRVGEGHLIHDNNGFTLTGCEDKLNYSQKPQFSYSLYCDYYWYEIDDVIGIGDTEVHYFLFPKNHAPVAKVRLATEEMYKLYKAKQLPPVKE